jgi:hypothetical protein
MVRLLVTTCIALAALDVFATPVHLGVPITPGSIWTCECLGSPQPGSERTNIQAGLEQLPGKLLVLVRYAPNHNPGEEWVYNSVNIDGSKVIWARDSDVLHNAELISYYKDREVWLVQPDTTPATLSKYPADGQAISFASISH